MEIGDMLVYGAFTELQVATLVVWGAFSRRCLRRVENFLPPAVQLNPRAAAGRDFPLTHHCPISRHRLMMAVVPAFIRQLLLTSLAPRS